MSPGNPSASGNEAPLNLRELDKAIGRLRARIQRLIDRIVPAPISWTLSMRC